MTYAVRVYEQCVLDQSLVVGHGDPNGYHHTYVDCGAVSSDIFSRSGFIAANRSLITAGICVYGITAILLSGVPMCYSFFLARRVRQMPTGWLFSTRRKYSKRTNQIIV